MIIFKRFLIRISLLICFTIFFSCEREISTSPQTAPVPVASIFIESDPPGAKIYEDGRNSGKHTPDSLTWLEEKTYTFTLKMDLFRDTSFSVEISKDEKKEIFINYYTNPKMYGSISCTSNPDGAVILLNGEDTGKETPAKFEGIWPGRYKVKCIKNNCRSDSIEFEVRSNFLFDAHLKLIDTTYWVDYTAATSGIHDDYLSSVAVDKNNIVWAGSAWGLSSFDGSNWTIHNIPNYETRDNFVNNLKVDSSGVLWVCTLNGLNSFNGISWKKYKSPPLPSSNINDVTFEKDGTIWVATDEGLAKSSNHGWINFKKDSTLEYLNGTTTGVDIDNNNDIWVVTKGLGIGRYEAGSWRLYEFAAHNAYNTVSHSEDYVWFGHAENSIGLSSYQGGYFNRIFYLAFANLAVYNISIYGEEKWLSTSFGLHTFKVYNATRKAFYAYNSGLTTNEIQDVAFDKNGNVWVATNGGGLYKFKYQH